MAQHYRARILVVDDFKPWRRYIRGLLEQRTDLLVVAEAADGIEAIAKACEHQPDLVVLDIGLPRLNGIEAARQIHQVAPPSKILFVSIERSTEFIEEALNLGASDYIRKAEIGSKLLPAVDALCFRQ